jgi:predicted DNA-binding transcriptional regulator YafY
LGINSESDRAASLVIGPTSLGMVRIFVESDGIEVPMDFEPDEALDIASELRAAAEIAAATAAAQASKKAENDQAGRSGEDGGRPRGAKAGQGPASERGGNGRRG